MSHNTAGFLWTTNFYLPLDPLLKMNWKVNFEGIVLLSKLLETESLAEVQFVIDSCRFVT